MSAITIAKVSDTPPGTISVHDVDGVRIALCNVNGRFYAVDDVCTHDGGPLSDGPLDATALSIACPRHGAAFSVKTGAALTMPATQPTVAHEVKVEGGRVLVRLND